MATAIIMGPALLVMAGVADINDLRQPWRTALGLWCLVALVWGMYRLKEDAIAEGKAIQHREWLKALGSTASIEPPFTADELAWMKGSRRVAQLVEAEVDPVREHRTRLVNRCASVVGKPSVTPDEADQAWSELYEAVNGAREDASRIVELVEKSGKERQ
jgi:hypothetical protein